MHANKSQTITDKSKSTTTFTMLLEIHKSLNMNVSYAAVSFDWYGTSLFHMQSSVSTGMEPYSFICGCQFPSVWNYIVSNAVVSFDRYGTINRWNANSGRVHSQKHFQIMTCMPHCIKIVTCSNFEDLNL